MSRKMLVNIMHPEEARFAIIQDGRLMDLNIEITGKEQAKGNIYKGVVLRVEQGLQAAFIDIGLKKPGFLQMGELLPRYWQWREDLPEEGRRRRPRMQEVVRRGQELVVQIEKDERDNKGAALTSYLSLPGRYMVIMPESDSKGISRKIEKESDRKRLKAQIAEMSIPEGIGYIIRTEAVGRTTDELQKDLDSLMKQYRDVMKRADEASGPVELYHDSGLVLRTIRDYFSDDIEEILLDNRDAFNQAQEFLESLQPGYGKRVKLHREKRPIFSKYQLEEQIDQLYEKRVSLPSGGYLIIEPTEALVSIDVNSGKTTGEKGIEDTAFKSNMEAAEEVARQLRLRDLGGLVVIDFIDMRDRKHNQEVERTLKDALKADKARMQLGRISEFGLLEMSRQRIAKTINDAINLECPHCEGRGKVKSAEAMALSFLRKVHAAAAKGNVSEVRGGLPLEVAYYLLNRKKRELAQIENDYDIEVTVKGKPSFLLNQLELDVVKREKSPADEPPGKTPPLPADSESQPPAPQLSTSDEGNQEPGKKKKRRRKKKKQGAESPETPVQKNADHGDASQTESPELPKKEVPDSDAETMMPETDSKTARKRKRTRGRKKAPPSIDAGTPEIGSSSALQPAPEEPYRETPPAEPEKAKSRARKAAKSVRTNNSEPAAPVPDMELSLPDASNGPVEPAPKKQRARKPKKESPLQEPADESPESSGNATRKTAVSRPRRSKKTVS